MKLEDYIGKDYTEQRAKNFLFYKAIDFLKMLQEEKGNLNNLDEPNKTFAFDEMEHILTMNEEIDVKFGNPEKEMLELLKKEISKLNLNEDKELISYLYEFAKKENDKKRIENQKEVDEVFKNDKKVGKSEDTISSLLQEEMSKDTDAAIKEVYDEMNPVEKLVYDIWIAFLKGTDIEVLAKMIAEEKVNCDKWIGAQKKDAVDNE